jgi:hypothetical protein
VQWRRTIGECEEGAVELIRGTRSDGCHGLRNIEESGPSSAWEGEDWRAGFPKFQGGNDQEANQIQNG